MKIEGIIISGTKEGSYFISQKTYNQQFKDKLGFQPFPGTLNIQVREHNLTLVTQIPDEEKGIIEGKGDFGDVKFIKAELNNRIDGALLFPVKTHHPQDILEFIASENLRETLNLKDGDMVTLDINI